MAGVNPAQERAGRWHAKVSRARHSDACCKEGVLPSGSQRADTRRGPEGPADRLYRAEAASRSRSAAFCLMPGSSGESPAARLAYSMAFL